ncbi:MAG: TonB-dependent receptor [Nannocystaceae bacterium]
MLTSDNRRVLVQTETDANGDFVLSGVDRGTTKLVITAPGYDRLDAEISDPVRRRFSQVYYLRKAAFNPYKTTVSAGQTETAPTEHRLIRDELEMVPGARGDPLRAAQNLPGMSRTPFGLGLLIMRGASPRDSTVYLGDHPIPRLYHFGGLSSVFQSNLLESLTVMPGNFAARYGNTIGGILQAKPRRGTNDKGVHGHGDLSLMDLSLRAETRVKRGNVAIAARRSHGDALIGLILRATGDPPLPIPRYWDYQALFDHPTKSGFLSLRAFGSDDRLVLVPKRRGETPLQNASAFHRADLVYRARVGPWKFLLAPSYLRDTHHTYLRGEGAAYRARRISDRISSLAEMTRRFSPRWSTTLGSETSATWWRSQLASTGDLDNHALKGASIESALYTTLRLRVGGLSLIPELRYSQFGANVASSIDPRLRSRWRVTGDISVTASVGLFSQAPSYAAPAANQIQLTLSPERASHLSLGISLRTKYNLKLSATGYYKRSWNILWIPQEIMFSPDLTNYQTTPDNNAYGRMYGTEILIRKNLTRRLFGWIAYTWSRSDRRRQASATWVLHPFDQPHALVAVAGIKLPRRYRLSTRFRFTSGTPYTPCVARVLNAQSDQYDCLPGAENGARSEPFHQLDLRADKTWIGRKTSTSLYLDVNNVYNRSNVEMTMVNAGTTGPVVGLPILPIFGMRVDF